MCRHACFFIKKRYILYCNSVVADATYNFEMRGTIMKKLTFSAAAIIAVAGVLASASANAEHNSGGPIIKGDQCFTYGKAQSHDLRFGTWGACPKTASATATTTTVTLRNGRKITQTAASKPAAGGGGAIEGQHQQGYWGN
jgi:hypothetical protein